MSKEALRKAMLNTLSQMTEMERKNVEKAIQRHLFDSSLWKQAETVGVTLSMDKEWDTKAIIEHAWLEGKKVCVPKSIHKTRGLHFYEITSFKQVEKGYFNLSEPIVSETERIEDSAIDLLIVPGLVFTDSGYRIGFGGGYYDRFLEDFGQTTLSLMHSTQQVDFFPIEAHDIPVQHLITEKGLIKAKEH